MPAVNLLSDLGIKAALKAGKQADAPKRLLDGDGLHLEVRPGGSGWWRLRYRFAGKEGMLSLGTYPEVPLSLARERRDAARKLIAAGTDPSLARKEEKAARQQQQTEQALAAAGKPGPGTFEYVAREWLAEIHESAVSAGHAQRTRIRFEQDAFPWLGGRPLAEIEAPEVLACLRRVTARGAIETAHRLKDACGQVFRYGIATGACTRNPAADLRDALPPVPTRHLAAIVEPKRASELLRAMGDYAGHPVTRSALALSALLFLRPGELRQLEWAWVDLDAAVVTIPAALMKRRRDEKENGPPHLVPLAEQAMRLLRELQPLTGHGRYLFPSLITGERPMSDNTINVALRRMGFDRETATAHGFRAMARTMAAERLGIAPEVIEAQLAHAKSGPLGAAYDRAQYLDQRRDLMQRWADYLDRLRTGAEVIPIRPPEGQRPR
ncbi:MAG TPA: integrase arm-type DNA-binding domain-containing protein [Aquabacterium sp.]|nr:integrase arm-type DNA-binding domain-containing protein [Aquabacterium sp.]